MPGTEIVLQKNNFQKIHIICLDKDYLINENYKKKIDDIEALFNKYD